MTTKIETKEIIKLIDLLEERNLTELEMEVEGLRIKITRNLRAQPPQGTARALASVLESEPDESSPFMIKPEEEQNSLHIITAPMVGTFYRAPDPSSPPFVEVGETVNKNQTLCIIEAMKLMNEIESDIDGVVAEICAQNGMPIEYGQRLFTIRPV